jgi:hypothetical protein
MPTTNQFLLLGLIAVGTAVFVRVAYKKLLLPYELNATKSAQDENVAIYGVESPLLKNRITYLEKIKAKGY